MLVLTRKPGETIRIGDDITITVVQLGRGRVRVGIEAPQVVPVLRGELRAPQSAIAPASTNRLAELAARRHAKFQLAPASA